jgi:hypothetical protein
MTGIVTAHLATVLDVVKAHPRAVSAGAVQEVLQFGGRIRRPDAFETHTVNSFSPLPLGSEWVLFLLWDERLNGFTLLYHQDGAVQIVDGKVAAATGFHRSWDSRPVEEFLQALSR